MTTYGAAPAGGSAPSWWDRQGDLMTKRALNGWTFTHMNWLLPTERIARGDEHRPLPSLARDLKITYWFGGRSYNLDELHRRTETTAFVVLHRGVVVHESYPGRFAGPRTRMQLFSVSKSVLAMLVGIAVAEGALRLDDPVGRHRADLGATAWGDVTVDELLSMASGVGDLEDWDDPDSDIKRFERAVVGSGDVTELVRSTPRMAARGQRFNYSTYDSQVLGWMLEAATGMSLAEYASTRLWQRIGADQEAYYWLTRSRPRTAIGGGSLNATVRDVARLGLLMANDGIAGGVRILPSDWVLRSRTPRWAIGTLGPSGYPHYGYAGHWWTLDGGANAALGVHGQYLYVDPVAEMVVVKCSGWPTQDDEVRDAETITAFRALASHLAVKRAA